MRKRTAHRGRRASPSALVAASPARSSQAPRKRSRRAPAAVSGIDHVRRDLDRRRRRRQFGDVITAFNKVVPERQGQLQAGRQQPPDGARDGGRGRPSARHGGHRAAGPRQAARAAGAAEADHVREAAIARELRAVLAAARHVQRKLYALVFKAANKSLLWYNVPAFKSGRCDAAEDVGAAHARPRRRSRRPARRPTRSAARTGGRSPTCSRTSTSARSGRRSTTP